MPRAAATAISTSAAMRSPHSLTIGAQQLNVARGGNDSTVFTVGIQSDLSNFYITRIEEFHKILTDVTTDKVVSIGKEEGIERVTIDTSGLGGGVTDQVRKMRNNKLINFVRIDK